MRGFSAFIFEALLPGLIASLFALGIFVAIRKSWRARHDWADRPPSRVRDAFKETITLVAFLMFIALMLTVSYSRFRLHYGLWTLKTQDVQEMKVGTRQFTDPTSIEKVVHDLKSSEWYSVSHGGWGDETAMVLTMRSGDVWQMQVGYHLTQHGAVILRSSEPGGRGWHLGELFSATLPQTLDKLGVPLSRCDMAHGHPCTAQTSP